MVSRVVPDLCKSTIQFLRSALSSLEFPIIPCVDQFNERSQTNYFYFGTEKLSALVNHNQKSSLISTFNTES